jgi:hypothetical protein
LEEDTGVGGGQCDRSKIGSRAEKWPAEKYCEWHQALRFNTNCEPKRRGKAAIMHQNSFGELWPVSALTLGGGGIGMVWGETTFDECVATVHEAVAAGISLIDLAPSYGDGRAERVVGEAFGGRPPDGVRITSKCNLGNPSSEEIEPLLRQSIEGSLERLRLSQIDLFFLHSNVVPDENHMAQWPDAARRMTPYATFVEHVRPVFERLVGEGLIGAWGLTCVGHPDMIIKIAWRAPGPGGSAVHRQSAGLAWRAQIFPRTCETSRHHGSGARERGRRDGYSRGAGGSAD